MTMSNQSRRHFLTLAATTLAASHGGLLSAVTPQPKSIGSVAVGPSTADRSPSFGPLKQIDAGVLRVGYAEEGPAGGPPVILLHGWPYDIHSYAEATALLVAKGYRVVVPYLRGYGTTRFLSEGTFRNGQQSALAVDVINLMDALNMDKAIIAGFDWGARTATILAALWPERC
jgi:predicted alpha/beta-fold hydrolase